MNLASVMSAAGYEVVYKGKWRLRLKKDPLERWNLAHKPSRMTPFQKANFQRLERRIHHIEGALLQPPAAG